MMILVVIFCMIAYAVFGEIIVSLVENIRNKVIRYIIKSIVIILLALFAPFYMQYKFAVLCIFIMSEIDKKRKKHKQTDEAKEKRC